MASQVDIHTPSGSSRFCIPPPRSLGKFIIFPSLWSMPSFNNLGALMRRIKTNLLYFQTNYLILTLALFVIFTILSMKTLLTGIVSSVIIVLAVLFFFEHIPQARQIKQNHPTLVIIAGIALIIVTWHALHTILFVIAAIVAPLPLWFVHAAFRSSDHILDDTQVRADSFSDTPVGQIMQIFGIDPRA